MNQSIPPSSAPTSSTPRLIQRILCMFFALAVAFWCTLPTANAATTGTWLGNGANGNWSTSANWSAIADGGGQAYFNLSTSQMTVTLDANRTLAGNASQGGLVFTGSAYSAGTGYTINASNGAVLTLNATTWVQIDPAFMGSNITETIGAPIVLSPAAGAITETFANWTPTSVSYQAGGMAGYSASVPQGLVASGTNNLLVFSGSSISMTGGNNSILWLTGVGNTTISGNLYSGAVAGTSLGLAIDGLGTYTLSGSNTFAQYASQTTQVWNGTLALDFTAVSASNSKIGAYNNFALGGADKAGNSGGTLMMVNNSANQAIQAVRNTNLGPGFNNISFSGTGTGLSVFDAGPLGAPGTGLPVNGATLNFNLPAGTQSGSNGVYVLTANADSGPTANVGVLGGWATVNQTDWATSTSTAATAVASATNGWISFPGATVGQMVAFPNTAGTPAGLSSRQTYYVTAATSGSMQISTIPGGAVVLPTSAGAAGVVVTGGNINPIAAYATDIWASGTNTTVSTYASPSSGSTTNTLRFNANNGGGSNTLTLSGTNTITTGGILDTPNVTNPVTITGGNLVVGAGNPNYYFNQFSSAPLTVASNLTSNMPITKSGAGTLILSGNNTGPVNQQIYVNSGTVKVGSAGAFGSGSNQLQVGNTATFDLNGRNVQFRNLYSDTQNEMSNQFSGTLAAKLGLTANITNSVPGTAATLTIGDAVTPVNSAGTFTGGLSEATGAILNLNVIGTGQTFAATGLELYLGGAFGGNSPDAIGNQSWNNTITGGVYVSQGAAFAPNAGGYLNMMGAFTLNGGSTETNKQAFLNTTYLAGSGFLLGNTGFGNNEAVSISHLGSVIDASQVRTTFSYNLVGVGFFEFGGAGSYSVPSIFSVSNQYMGSTATLTTPSVGQATVNSSMNVYGESTLRLTGGAGSSSANPTTIIPGMRNTFVGTMALVPSGSNGAIYLRNGLMTNSANSNIISQGATTFLLDAGANTSLTFTLGVGNPNGNTNPTLLNRTNPNSTSVADGTYVIAAAQGLSALGTTDKFNLFSYSPSVSFNPMVNGIMPGWMVGQDASPGSTKPATFLTYSYTGATGSNTDTGFAPVTFANTNNLATAQANTLVEHVTSSVTLSQANYSVNALQLDNATVTVGGAGGLNFAGTAPYGLILNSGTIATNATGKLDYSAGDLYAYTSLSGATISSNLNTGNSAMVKFGPGVLSITGTMTSTGGGQLLQAGVLDVSTIPFVAGASAALGGANGYMMLHGGVLEGQGTYTRALGVGAGQVSWTGGNNNDVFSGGGFSAKGGPLTVSLTGGPASGLLIWGMGYTGGAGAYPNGYFLAEYGVLNFGATDSNNVVTLTNNIELGVPTIDTQLQTYSRVVSVAGNSGDLGLDPLTVADSAVLSGTIQSTNPIHILTKDGSGVLVLSGTNNTYSAGTQIAKGTLVVSASDSVAGSSNGSVLGVAPTAAYPLNVQVGMNGGALTPGAVVIDGGAVLASATNLAAFTLNGNRSLLLASGSNGANASSIDVYTGNTFTVPGLIGDYLNERGNLGKMGAGTLVISGSQANPFTGGLTINNGTVQNASPNSANVLGSGNVSFGTSNTPTLDLNGHNVTVGLLSGAGSNSVITTTSNAVVTLTLAGSGSQSYAGAINNGSGTVALTVAGGTQILTGANGFNGTVTLSGGTLQATNAALNATDVTNGIVFNGGALQAGLGGISTAKAVAMTGAGTFDTNGQNSNLSGNVTGAGGAFSKAGSGTLVLSGLNNTFSGGLTVNNGTVQAGSGAGTAVLGSGNVTFGMANSPTVDLNGNSVTVGLLSGLGTNGVVNSSVGGSITLTLAGSGNQVFGGSVQDGAGTVSLTVNTGAQILTGVSSYSGQTSVYGGSLTVTGTGAIANSSGLSIGGNGTFNFVTGTTGQVLTVQNLTTPYDSGTSSFGVEVGNSINVVHSPTGYRTLAVNLFAVPGMIPDPTFSGTQITVLTAPDSLDNYIGYILGNVYGATNFTVTVPPASNNPSTGFGNTVSMQITGATPLASATWQGAFAAGNNVWAISNGSTASNWTTTGGASTSLVPGAVTNVTFSSTSANVGNMSLGANMAINSLTTSATGSMVLQDAINTLTVSGTKGIAVNAGSGTVNLNVGLVLNGANAQALTANNATGLTISGPISGGANGITVNGTNTVTLAANNTFTGPLTVSAGTLLLNGTNAFTGLLTISGGALLNTTTAGINGSSTTNGLTFGTGGGTLQAAASGISTAKAVTMTGAGTIDTSFGNVTLGGALTGAATLTKIGSGTLVLGGSNNAYTGGITINNGIVQLSNTNAGVNGLTAGTLTFGASNTPTLDLNSCSASVGAVSALYSGGHQESNALITNSALSGIGTLGITVASGTTQFCPAIMDGTNGGVVAVVKSGTGALYLEGYGNNFSGGLTINNGTIIGQNGSNRGGLGLSSGIITFAPGVVITATTTNPTLDLQGVNNGLATGLLAGSDTNGLVISSAGAAGLTLTNPGTATFAGSILQSAFPLNTITLTLATTAGTQVLSGSNNFTGAIAINGGNLVIGSDQNIGGSSGTVTVTSASTGTKTVVLSSIPAGLGVNSAILGSTVASIAGTTLTLAANANATIASGTAVSFATDTTITIGGYATLTATNSFTMGESNSSTSYPATLNRALTIGNQWTGSIDVTGTNIFTVPGLVTEGALSTLMKTDSGTLALTGANVGIVGYVQIAGGLINATTTTLNAGSLVGLVMNGGGIQVTSGGALTLSKPVSLTSPYSGGSIDTNGISSAVLVSGLVSGPGSLTLNSSAASGTMQLTGANTFSGGLVINNGTVLGSSTAQVGEFGSGDVTFGSANSPILDLNGQSATTGLLSGTAGNGLVTSGVAGAGTITLTLSNTTTKTFAGIIQKGSATTLNLTKNGVGTQILTGSNTYNGVTTISQGTLSTNLLANGGSASGIGMAASGTANLAISNGTLQYTGPSVNCDRGFMVGAGGATIDASGSGPLNLTYSGTLGNNSGGTAYLTLTGSNTGANTLAAVLSSNANFGITKAGSGTWVLTGTSANPFSGSVVITGGVLGVQGTSNATNTFGPQNQGITFNGVGATIQATGPMILLNGGVTLTTTGIIDTQSNLVQCFDQMNGTGGLVKNGSGTLIMGYGGAGNYWVVGGLTINNGTVGVVNRAVNFGSGNVTFGPSNTPTMDLSGQGGITGLLIGGSNAVVTNSGATASTQTLSLTGTGSGTATFAGTIQNNPIGSGTGLVAVSLNGGTQVLSGNNTYTGATVVSGSTSMLIVSGSLSGTVYVTVQNGGTLGGAGIASAGSVSVAATGGTVAPGNLNGGGASTEGTLSANSLDLSAGGTNAHLSMQLGGTAVNGIVPSDTIKLGTGVANVTNADLLTSLVAGYTPAPGDTFFLVINAGGGVTGTFATVNGLVGSYGQDQVFPINGVNYELSYNAAFNGGIGSVFDGTGHDIALMVAVPEPGTWALLVGGMGMLGLWQRRRSKI